MCVFVQVLNCGLYGWPAHIHILPRNQWVTKGTNFYWTGQSNTRRQADFFILP